MTRTPPPLRAITLDLDDTLWPVWPAIVAAEQALQDWLSQAAPAAAQRFPIERMRALRAEVAEQHPQLAHDYCAQRLISLERALAESGEDPARAAEGFEVFFAARNAVQLYDDSLPALHRLAARLPLAALTNGNACIRRIGLDSHFVFSLGAREHGAAKPEPSIFLAACERLGCAPEEVLHVGDDPHMDVIGARRAGLRAAWINRRGEAWSQPERPDIEITTLLDLVDWVDAAAPR